MAQANLCVLCASVWLYFFGITFGNAKIFSVIGKVFYLPGFQYNTFLKKVYLWLYVCPVSANIMHFAEEMCRLFIEAVVRDNLRHKAPVLRLTACTLCILIKE